MRQSGRRWVALAAVALAHLAALWLLASSVRKPAFVTAPGGADVAQIGLVDGLPFSLRRLPRAKTHDVSAPVDLPPDPPPPPADDAGRTEPVEPVATPPAPDLTREPEEIGSDALHALQRRIAAANLAGVSSAEATCGVTASLQAALGGDASVQTALMMIPPESRSVANAVTVWNDGWTDAQALGGPEAALSLRTALNARVMATRRRCRDLLMQGPRLLVVATPQGPTVLSIGSGRWRWADLLR